MLLNNKWVKKEMKGDTLKHGNENITNQIVRDTAKVVLQGKFIVLQVTSRNKKNLK